MYSGQSGYGIKRGGVKVRKTSIFRLGLHWYDIETKIETFSVGSSDHLLSVKLKFFTEFWGNCCPKCTLKTGLWQCKILNFRLILSSWNLSFNPDDLIWTQKFNSVRLYQLEFMACCIGTLFNKREYREVFAGFIAAVFLCYFILLKYKYEQVHVASRCLYQYKT